MFFDAVSSEELTALIRIVVDVVRAETATPDGGEVVDDLLGEGDPAADLMAAASSVDWDAVIEAGIPALAKGAKQLNTLELDFIRAVSVACSTIETPEELNALPVVDVYAIFEAASKTNSVVDLIAAEKNLWAPVLEAMTAGDDE